MIRKFFALFFAALLSSASLSILATAPACAEANWAFEVNKGIEKSKRTYLLVYAPQEKNERRIKVTSDCEKPFHAEGTYGKCSHAIEVYPTKAEFVLSSGEDVILLQSPTQKMILATL